jgi:O-acetylhomoserine (thiol)-lyase
MKRETLAIHAGYDGDPTTKAVAVPIYQTVAFEFDSAEHGAALFNLEVQGNIYTRIGNPTNTVLEKRMAALEGGVDGLSVSSGMAAIEYALINIAETGNNIVSTPQLYGATYTTRIPAQFTARVLAIPPETWRISRDWHKSPTSTASRW